MLKVVLPSRFFTLTFKIFVCRLKTVLRKKRKKNVSGDTITLIIFKNCVFIEIRESEGSIEGRYSMSSDLMGRYTRIRDMYENNESTGRIIGKVLGISKKKELGSKVGKLPHILHITDFSEHGYQQDDFFIQKNSLQFHNRIIDAVLFKNLFNKILDKFPNFKLLDKVRVYYYNMSQLFYEDEDIDGIENDDLWRLDNLNIWVEIVVRKNEYRGKVEFKALWIEPLDYSTIIQKLKSCNLIEVYYDYLKLYNKHENLLTMNGNNNNDDDDEYNKENKNTDNITRDVSPMANTYSVINDDDEEEDENDKNNNHVNDHVHKKLDEPIRPFKRVKTDSNSRIYALIKDLNKTNHGYQTYFLMVKKVRLWKRYHNAIVEYNDSIMVKPIKIIIEDENNNNTIVTILSEEVINFLNMNISYKMYHDQPRELDKQILEEMERLEGRWNKAKGMVISYREVVAGVKKLVWEYTARE